MSFAMDDVNGLKLNSLVPLKQTEETRIVEKQPDVKSTDSSRTESEISDEYELSQKRLYARQKELESSQQKFTDIDVKKQEIQKNSEELNAIVQKFNEEAEKTEQKFKLSDKIDEIAAKIEKQKNELEEKQKEINVIPNSIIKLDIKENKTEEIKIEQQISQPPQATTGEELKKEAIKSIKQNPEHSIKVHIKHLDRDLLLAMLSLRSA
jgi:DNA repair exonuclease SbcCD ATPase subunit